MKSLCIKTNDSDLLNYLLNELKSLNLLNIYHTEKEFKSYKNIIIHYVGPDNSAFLAEISNLLAFLVIDEMEDTIIRRLLIQNYFYFNSKEREKILDICFDLMSEDYSDTFKKKFETLYDTFYSFLSTNKSLILSGFINFRLKDYMTILDEVVNCAVNNYVIEKEYNEFVSLLKLYIESQPYGCDIVHIIFSGTEAILLDKDKHLIVMADNIFQPKILSDISFSSNDYVLNSLLTLLPKQLYVHLENSYINEFINTLQLIFGKRLHICTNCKEELQEEFKGIRKDSEKFGKIQQDSGTILKSFPRISMHI